ncbi:hypothetical protein [Pseudomonas putida]|uniref:hypothetical protein n=1 Tax=Pseudomonas putida TaxID=303 RepID=UPI0021F8B073|nr:hypothetical protein [Pseudomonas putida]
MPTENRSSNTEMVSVLQREDRYIVIKRSDLGKLTYTEQRVFSAQCRKLHERMFAAGAPARQFLVIESDWPEYEPAWAAIESRVTGKPAEQRQGEPVAWRFRWSIEPHKPWIYQPEKPVDSRGYDIEPLYTHVDPGEVERLREVIKHSDAQIMRQSMRISNQRDQLAERDAPHPIRALGQEAYSTLVGMVEFCLNKRVCLGMDEGYKNFLEEEGEHDFMKELRSFVALSASAEPSAPTWVCLPCKIEQPTDRPCAACGAKTELKVLNS